MSKYVEEKKFIKEHSKHLSDKDGNTVYQMNRQPYNSFLKTKGITTATITQMAEAEKDYQNGAIAAVTDILKGSKDTNSVTLRTRTTNGRIDTKVVKTVKTNNPSTGEKFNRHGVISIRSKLKQMMDKDLLKDCADEIGKMVK